MAVLEIDTITDSILEALASYKEELAATPIAAPTPPLSQDKQEYTFLLAAVSSARVMDGIPQNMGHESMYYCRYEDMEKARLALFSLYGLSDAESVAKACNTKFYSSIEFDIFRTFWAGKPEFNTSSLNGETKKAFDASMAFAKKLYGVVGNLGFLAWDINERVGLCRKACAARIITEAAFWKMTAGAVARANAYFDDWREYALSCLAGSAYYMYRETDGNIEEAARFFHHNLALLRGLTGEGGLWQTHGWPEREGKRYAIRPRDIINLMAEWEGPSFCLASDRITVDGMPVGYMNRTEPISEEDSGWRFAAGDEDEAYMNTPSNFGIYSLNTIVNADMSVKGYLLSPVGTSFARNAAGTFSPED